jgi:hypothetical protein
MLQAALSCIDDAAVVLDEHGNFLVCNAAAELLGLSGMNAAQIQSGLTDSALRKFKDSEGLEQQADLIARALQGEQFSKPNVLFRLGDSNTFLVELKSRPFEQATDTTGGISNRGVILLFRAAGSPQTKRSAVTTNSVEKGLNEDQPELEFFRELFDLMPQLGWTALRCAQKTWRSNFN